MARLSEHFVEEEFRCRDGCGWSGVAPLLVERLERLRALIKKPIPIRSGRRCPVHNTRVDGASRSRHVYGDAADIPKELGVTVRQAREVGFTGIGKNRDGQVIHVDVRPKRGAPVIWTY